MLEQDVDVDLMREPFVPLRLHLKDGKRFDLPYPEMFRLLTYGILVFIGHKRGTHQSKSYDRFSYDQIDRIEQRPVLTGGGVQEMNDGQGHFTFADVQAQGFADGRDFADEIENVILNLKGNPDGKAEELELILMQLIGVGVFRAQQAAGGAEAG